MQWTELSREEVMCTGRVKCAAESEATRQSCLVEITHFQ